MPLNHGLHKFLLLVLTATVLSVLLSGGIFAGQPDRAMDRLSPKDFNEPPHECRPSGSWDLGSVLVVFRKVSTAPDSTARDTFIASEFPTPLAIDGPWQVDFPEGWCAPTTNQFDKLQSWTESEDQGIKFFSGIATYRKTFDLPDSLAKQKRLFLELGELAEIAEVTLNGTRLGLTWLPPYRLEVSDTLKAGPNQLEIRIANLWANRLNGDSLLPESKRFTRSNLDRIQTDPTSDSAYGKVPMGPCRPVYTKVPPLMKSGLLGPVRIIAPK